MPRLSNSLKRWGQPDFNRTLQAELEQLNGNELPLQEALASASYASYDKRQVMVIGASADAVWIHVRAGIFYAGVVAGCNCADDPTPVEESIEYCEVAIDIDRVTAEAEITLIRD
jgi:hypothetical protein